MDVERKARELLACPFCGETPTLDMIRADENQGGKWGSVVCCITGPEVRTGYDPVESWRDEAIAAWNTRALQDGGEGCARSVSEPPLYAPTHSIPLLVYLPEFGWRRGHYTGFYAATGRWPWSADGMVALDAETITHWMPLPPPPPTATPSRAGMTEEGRSGGIAAELDQEKPDA